jgi:hypothetical protein
MNPMAVTWIRAMEKRGFLGAALSKAKGVAKGVGTFALQMPIWLTGSAGLQKMFGKEPEVKRVTVPRPQYEMLRRHTLSQALSQYRQGGS